MLCKGISQKEFSLLQEYIHKNCGIMVGKEKQYLIESRLSRLLIDYKLNSFEELYSLLARKNDRALREKIIDAITTNETLWFRDKTPWEIIESILLPGYIEEFKAGRRRKVRIWSAAASTGQEAYSTVMLIDKYLKDRKLTQPTLNDFEITGTDISNTVLEIARMGRYDNISIIRGLSEDYKKAYFTNHGRTWEIDGRIKKSVSFNSYNLQDSFIRLGKFDIIFLRYVLIYFATELKDDISRRCGQAMEKNGVLFAGNAEIFPNKDNLFDLKTYKSSVYYQIKG